MALLYLWILCAIVLESFPISSSGHLALLENLFTKFFRPFPIIPDGFDYFLHGPIALVVAIFFYPRWRIYMSLLQSAYMDSTRFSKKLAHHERREHVGFKVDAENASSGILSNLNAQAKIKSKHLPAHGERAKGESNQMSIVTIIKKVFTLGFITEVCTVALYILFAFTGDSFIPLWVGFFTTALLLLSLYWCPPFKPGKTWNYKNALLLGTVQGVALLPGISRFASTYVTARWLGLRGQRAFELSFLIEWPLIVAGFFKGLLKIVKTDQFHDLLNLNTVLVMIVASIFAYLGLWIMSWCVKNKKMWAISLYLFFITIVALFAHP